MRSLDAGKKGRSDCRAPVDRDIRAAVAGFASRLARGHFSAASSHTDYFASLSARPGTAKIIKPLFLNPWPRRRADLKERGI